MTRYAGLEIDSRALRLAIFDGTPKKFELVEFIDEELRAETDDEREAIIRDILSDVLSKKENLNLEVVTSLDARSVVLREISVPYVREEHIAKTIRYEAESYIHSQSIDDVVVEYLKCSETEDSSRLVLAIVPKERVEKHLSLTHSVNIDPIVVELDATAIATSFANTPLYSGEQNVLLVELEAEYSRLVFLEKDRVVKIRSVWDRPAIVRQDRLLEDISDEPRNGTSTTEGAGGDPKSPMPESSSATATATANKPEEIERRFEEIERALSRLDQHEEPGRDGESAFGDDMPICVVPDDEYERLTTLPGEVSPSATPGSQGSGLDSARGELADLDEDTVLVLAAPETDPMERLFLEIERTFAAYALTNSIDLIVVTGPRAQQLDAVNRLAEHFEVDVVPFDLGDSFPIAWDGPPDLLNTRGAVACGLGLRALGRGISQFDLRKDEFKFERKFEQLMPSMMLVGLLAWALTLVWSFQNYTDHRRLQRELASVRQSQAELYTAFFDEKVPASKLNMVKRATDDKMRLVKGKTKNSRGAKDYFSTVEIMEEVLEAIKSAKVKGESGDLERIYPVFYNIDINPEVNEKVTTRFKLTVKSNSEKVALEEALNRHLENFKVKRVSQEQNKKTGMFELNVELNPRGKKN